jgi:hypothetical protein
MWRGVARAGAWVHHGVTERTEIKEGGGLPFWRVGSFCIMGEMARVGIVWRCLARFGARGFGLALTPALSHGRWGVRRRESCWRPRARE